MKKQPNRWLIFSGLAFQIALIMYVFLTAGQWLDAHQQVSNNMCTLVAGYLGMCCVIYVIIKQTKNIE